MDLSTAFKVLKEFRGNFHTHSVSDQAEVLRDVLAEIVMREDEVEFGLYGVEKPVISSTPDGLKIDQNLGHTRTGVRPLFNLVEAGGSWSRNCSPVFGRAESLNSHFIGLYKRNSIHQGFDKGFLIERIYRRKRREQKSREISKENNVLHEWLMPEVNPQP